MPPAPTMLDEIPEVAEVQNHASGIIYELAMTLLSLDCAELTLVGEDHDYLTKLPVLERVVRMVPGVDHVGFCRFPETADETRVKTFHGGEDRALIILGTSGVRVGQVEVYSLADEITVKGCCTDFSFVSMQLPRSAIHEDVQNDSVSWP